MVPGPQGCHGLGFGFAACREGHLLRGQNTGAPAVIPRADEARMLTPVTQHVTAPRVGGLDAVRFYGIGPGFGHRSYAPPSASAGDIVKRPLVNVRANPL